MGISSRSVDIMPAAIPFEQVLSLLKTRSQNAPAPDDPGYIEQTRSIWNAAAGPLPAEAIDIDIDGLRALWVVPTHRTTDRRVLFLHGGGFVFGSPETHRDFAQLLCDKLGADMLIPDYRLAPEHPFPCALNDAIKAAQYLLRFGPSGKLSVDRIAVIGDSAGGNLGLLLGMGPLSRVICALGLFSPWVDLTQSALWRVAAHIDDPVLTVDRLETARSAYIKGGMAEDRLASPIEGELSDLPPSKIVYGATELLAEDVRSFGERAVKAGAHVQLTEWSDVVHAWHLFGAQLEQGQLAIDEVVQFIARSLMNGGDDGA